jgi:hypothetical protein
VYFILEGFHVSIYDSLFAAALSVEAFDVANNEYVGYDDEGRSLRLEPLLERDLLGIAWGRSHVRITVSEEQPTHQEELRARLIGSLRQTDKWSKNRFPPVTPANASELPLQELVRVAVDTYGISS